MTKIDYTIVLQQQPNIRDSQVVTLVLSLEMKAGPAEVMDYLFFKKNTDTYTHRDAEMQFSVPDQEGNLALVFYP